MGPVRNVIGQQVDKKIKMSEVQIKISIFENHSIQSD